MFRLAMIAEAKRRLTQTNGQPLGGSHKRSASDNQNDQRERKKIAHRRKSSLSYSENMESGDDEQ